MNRPIQSHMNWQIEGKADYLVGTGAASGERLLVCLCALGPPLFLKIIYGHPVPEEPCWL